MLEVQHIDKTYENKPLLKDISFTVEEGQTLCLLGASGSGKSTLLRIIAGLEESDAGRVLFNGMDLTNTPPSSPRLWAGLSGLRTFSSPQRQR